MRGEDFDGIIIAYSCFDMIPVSPQFQADELREMLERIKEKAEDVSKNTSELKKEKEKLAKQLSELLVTLNNLSYDVYFDDLGITRLFVDEAHNYKNVPIATKLDNVLGIRSGGSKNAPR